MPVLTFTINPETVTAEQITNAKLAASPMIEHAPVDPAVKFRAMPGAAGGKQPFVLTDKRGLVPAKVGDWVVTRANGEIELWDNNDFQAQFTQE